MTFPINVNIPNANDFPGDDQPLMQTNFSNINGYLQVDHTNPANMNAGQHKQVTVNAFSTQVQPISPSQVGIAYTVAGVEDTTAPQLLFLNSDCNVLMTGLRAWAYYSITTDGSGNPTIASISNYNVNSFSVTNNGGGTYTATLALNSNVVSSNKYGVITNSGSINSQTFAGGVGTIKIRVTNVLPNTTLTNTFIVLQF